MVRTLTAILTAFVLGTGLAVAQSGSYSQTYSANDRLGIEFVLAIWNADPANVDDQKILVPYAREVCSAVFGNYYDQRSADRESTAAVKVTYLGFNDAAKAATVAFMAACTANGGVCP